MIARKISGTLAITLAAAISLAAPTDAASPPRRAATEAAFFTLGTGSGPTPQKQRAQPASLLMVGDQGILIDVGDGAAQQLGKIGVPLEKIQTVFISHLHFDHTGGLFGLLSRRFQLLVPGQLTIYGPPGTRATVASMLAAMAPGIVSAANIRARSTAPPEDSVKVVELRDGWSGKIGGVTVSAASNSHYVLQPEAAGKGDTYAFRFDTPGRSLVYTGDSGPSASVEALARGADVLFSEIMDPDESLADLKARRPDVSATALAAVEAHYRNQHLSPTEVGLMARRSGVKALVLTHNAIADRRLRAAKWAIAVNFKRSVTFANDLDSF